MKLFAAKIIVYDLTSSLRYFQSILGLSPGGIQSSMTNLSEARSFTF